MEESKKVLLTGIIFVLFIALVFGIYYLFIYNKPSPVSPTKPEVKEAPVQSEQEPVQKEESVEPLELELEESDEVVREKAQNLTSHPLLEDWLSTSSIIYKFTAAVDNIAQGLSPKPQIDFFRPQEEFEVIKKEGRIYIDPDSYRRYDTVVEVFLTLDSEECVRLYKQLKPTIQQAYRKLGYPDKDFTDTLIIAIMELLKVPVVEGNVLLEKKITTYRMVDPDLEGMSKAQKHLFRMGPQNVKMIQEKLREMALALGVEEDQLPPL